MNKTQFYSLSSALLASTALAGAASAGTVGVFNDTGGFSTAPVSISNTIFSTVASDANAVTIGGQGGVTAPEFGIRYTNNFQGTTRWSTDIEITGAQFVQATGILDNIKLLTTTAGTISGATTALNTCNSVTSLVDRLIINDCDAASADLGGNPVGGLSFTGVAFDTASGLATVGGTVSLTAFVFNPLNPSQILEPAASGVVLTSASPADVRVVAAADSIADPLTTPTAFTSLEFSNQAGAASSLSMDLVTVNLSLTGALGDNLTTAVDQTTFGTTNVTVASTLLSSGAVTQVFLDGTAVAATPGTWSGGSYVFELDATAGDLDGLSLTVGVSFDGETAIPAGPAGTADVTFGTVTFDQALAPASGATARVTHGGFRAEVNGFNAVGNGDFRSYLRVHNNGNVAGTVTVTAYNGTTGVQIGTFTSAPIPPNASVQLDDAQIETNIPAADRGGLYTLVVSGPIVGYLQHFLYDGNFVADMSSYRTTNTP